MQAWTLRDILHAGGLPPMEDHTDFVCLMASPIKKDPSLVGRTSVFQFQSDGNGLPRSLPINVRRVLLTAVKRDVANGVLQWRPPIAIGASMSLSLRNRLAPIESKNCYVRSILRPTARFHNKSMWDCVKFAVEGTDGRVKIYFARCLAFFRDNIGDHYVAVRWFEAANGDRNVIDPIVQMPRLQETCFTAPESYGVMPVDALLNGALLIPIGDIFYALQSPREQDIYLARNA
jgi:hypothetical protein